MKYVCLVYGEEKDLHALTPARSAKLDADSLAYDRALEESGLLIVAQALQSVKTAKT
ncbi:YciI family protein, partial [Mesorhizobium sp. M7A.F.Ca.ET.027.03.2.1]